MKPKFSIGQTVRTKPTLHRETTGAITEIHRIFAEVDETGAFQRAGLHTDERDIKSICIPFRFDGETLEVDYPEQDLGSCILKAFTQKSKFYGYAYTVKSATMLTLFSERSIKSS